VRLPSISFGQVHPLGVRNTIIGQRGRFVKPFACASDLIRWISPMTVSTVGGHQFMHRLRLVTLDEMRCISVAPEEVFQFIVADPSEDAGIGDLVAVEVEDRQDYPVGCRVQKFIGMPAGRQRSGFCLAVTDDADDDQIGVVKGGSVGM
jgi:hypothetical protein